MVKLTVDSSICIGCGLCAGTYDKAFVINDSGVAECVGELDDASAEDAIANCPVGAISK